MQVAVSKRDLLRVVARCQGVADKKSTMPVLGNVLLEVDGTDSLRLAATDLNLAVSGRIAAEVQKGGSIAVGARDLFERVKMMPDGPLTITTGEGSSATLRASTSARRYTLHGMPGEEFPAIPEPDAAAQALPLPTELLASLIAHTHFSISTDDTRLHLNSALFEWEGNRIRMVTTDGHRLSKMEIDLPGKPAAATMLIPLKGIQELRRLADEARGEAKGEGTEAANELTLLQSGPNAFFRLPGLQFSVKLVDAQFPPYQQVIPRSTDRIVVAPRLALADALRAVSIAASDRTGGVKLSLTRNTMRFASESPDSGEGFDEVSVDYDGGEITIGFNARYFLDVLGAFDEERVEIGIGGELDPVVLRPHGSTDYLSVIMPMRI
ncbi:MAG TPA: DNA polymerase III subunit beta [Polyangiaceae bacterium]|jgi:DNA polymerase-3 subunit beta|nr:DNA polymerase III subunit beta [Polyangiaceae bacterium]